MKRTASRVLLLLLLAPVPVTAWDNCDHKADRRASESLDGIERVVVSARAGDLRLERGDEANRLSAIGVACASSAKLLDGIQLETRRSGSTLHIETDMPETRGWNSRASMDLEIRVPSSVEMEVQDSSGDVSAEGVRLASIKDGSGDLSLRETSGDLRIDDGSGDIRISTHHGNVEIEDGSGDARLSEIDGSVRISEDGSGDLSMKSVSGSVTVDRDGSGDIFAGRVGGDFIVARDGSGDVRHRDVKGRVDVPADD